MAVGLLPRYIRLWHERYPDVGIRLQEFRHRSLLEEAVEQGVADFAIGPLPLRAWDGPLEQVTWEEFVVVAPPDDPLAARSTVRLEELADREWVLYHPDHGLAGILEEVCRRAGFSPRGTVRTSQAEGAARLASAGIGPALVPDNIVLPGHRGLGVLRLAPRMIRDVAVYARTELVARRRRRSSTCCARSSGRGRAARSRFICRRWPPCGASRSCSLLVACCCSPRCGGSSKPRPDRADSRGRREDRRRRHGAVHAARRRDRRRLDGPLERDRHALVLASGARTSTSSFPAAGCRRS